MTKHGLDVAEVRSALIYGRNFSAWWENKSVHGDTLVVVGNLPNGGRFIAHFHPVDIQDGIWSLKTARFHYRKRGN